MGSDTGGRVEVEPSAALIQLYRGEMQRSTAWLSRLDRPANLGVVTTTALLTFSLGNPDNPHGVLVLGMGSLLFFLSIEARRYRTYDVWRARVETMERNFFVPALAQVSPLDPGWRERLASDLLSPRYTMPLTEALGTRLRRTYGWLFAVLLLGWLGKLLIGSEGIRPLERVLERAGIQSVPGWVVLSLVVLFYLGLVVFAILTRRYRRASGAIISPDF